MRGFINQIPTGGSSVSLHNFNPAIPNICFITNDRGFSDNASVTSRLETKFIISLNSDGSARVIPAQGRTTSGVTKKVDCSTGAVLGQKTGGVDNDIIGTPSVADGTVQVYARQPGGKWTKIIQQLPIGIPWTLGYVGGTPFGINLSRIVETKTVSGISGKWQTPMPEQRFTLEFAGKKVKWTEKNQSGTTLTKEVEIKELSDGKFRIERPNIEEVLSFLGFQPGLRAEILAN